jgi:hypothetical protein
VPQEICQRWERNSYRRFQRTREGICQYSRVLIGGLIGIALGGAEAGARWQVQLKEFGVDDLDAGETLIEFLGKKRVLETVESNNLAGEFCWVTRLIAE